MRTAVLTLALGLVVGCSSPPTEVSTEVSTTDSPTSGSPTSSPASGDTTAASTPTTADSGEEEVCPPMPPEDGGYDPCPGLCGGGGQCFNDGAEYAVCTRGCFMDCNCWPAPAGDGDAQARCTDALLEATSVCVLDCSGGESCPRGMFCVPDRGICAHPYPGSDPDTSSSGSSDDTSSGGSTDTGTSSGSTDTGTTDGTTDSGTSDSGTTDGTTDAGSSGTTDGSATGPVTSTT